VQRILVVPHHRQIGQITQIVHLPTRPILRDCRTANSPAAKFPGCSKTVKKRSSTAVRVVSGKHLWAMKRKAQARDHELAARGEVPPAAMLLLRLERLQGLLIEWPDASLIDD
jgi:hypothetical protein